MVFLVADRDRFASFAAFIASPEFLQVNALGCRIRGTRWPREGECAEKFNRMHILAQRQLAEDVASHTALQLAHKNRAPATSTRALGGVFWERSGHRRCYPAG
jgi:hypothetical protein